MKPCILLLFIFIVSCNTPMMSFFEDDTVSSQDKKEVLLKTTEMKEIYKQYRAYHYMALALMVFGIASIAFKVTSTKIGVGSIAASIGLSAWATYAPANQGKIGIAIGGLLLSLAIYVIKKLIIDNLINRKPHREERPSQNQQDSSS